MHKFMFFILFLLSVTVQAENLPEIHTECQAKQTTVGVPVEYQVVIISSSDVFLTLPEEREYVTINEKHLPRSIITDKKMNKDETVGGYKWTVTISVIYLQPGKWALPAITVRDSASQIIPYEGAEIEVIPVNPGGQKEDIEDPVPLRGNYTRLVLLIMAAAVLVLLAIWAVKKLRRVKKMVQPAEDPYDIFKREAMALYSEDLIDRENIEEHMLRLSLIFRGFVSRIFSCNALESTSDEVLDILQGAGVDMCTVEKTRSIIFLWDLAKFAELRPARETARMNFEDTLKLAEDLSGWRPAGE